MKTTTSLSIGLLGLLPTIFLSCEVSTNTITKAGLEGFTSETDEPSARGQLIRVTPDETNVEYRFSISPDGTDLYFAGYQFGSGDQRLDIWKMNLRNGTLPTKITAGGFGDNRDPVVMKDNKYVLYSSMGKIWKVRSDGAGGRVLIPGSGMGYDYAPAISSQDVLAFCSLVKADLQEKSLIWTCSIDGSNLTQIREGSYPQWSPDGTRLVFEFAGDIWLVNQDGTELVQLTNTKDIAEGLPSFSQDGRKIIYTSNEGSPSTGSIDRANNEQTTTASSWNIWVMNMDGSNKTQITSLVAWNSWGVYRDDGIYFLSGRAQMEGRQVQRIWKLKH